jgi:hypothetical protein
MPPPNSDLPLIDWPEHYTPGDGKEVVDAIMRVFQTHCACDLLAAGITLLFVPDPPPINAADDAFRQSIANLTAEQVRRFQWGKRGLAYVCGDPATYRQLIACFLAMRSTTLSIIAIPTPAETRHTHDQLAAVITAFLDNAPEAVNGAYGIRHVGLFFDCGVLSAIGGA